MCETRNPLCHDTLGRSPSYGEESLQSTESHRPACPGLITARAGRFPHLGGSGEASVPSMVEPRPDVAGTGRTAQPDSRDRARRLPARLATAVSLERPVDRIAFGIGLVALALISPNIGLPGTLPAVRLEQLLLAIGFIPFVAWSIRHPETRRLGLVDAGFAILAVATALTLVFAPILVPGVGRSPRDVLELVRLVEYWLLYRIGGSFGGRGDGTIWLQRVLAGAGAILAVFAVIQYLNPSGFNEVVTALWTEAHNLEGVVGSGRAVGTAGNANQFGVLAILLLCVAFAGLLRSDSGRRGWAWSAVIVGCTVSLALAQSRGAILGAGVGVLVVIPVLASRGLLRRSIIRAAPPVAAGLVIIIALIVLAPPATGSIASRFSVAGILRDPSVVIRVARAEAVFGDSGNGPPAPGSDPTACAAQLAPITAPVVGHEPSAGGPTPARSDEANQVANAVAAYYCSMGSWPSDIARDLVPRYLPSVPPPNGPGPYSIYSSPRGYAVGSIASVDSAADAPGAGSLPNLLADGSFESPGSPPDQWLATPGVTALPTNSAAAYGQSAADAMLPGGGAIYQLLVADLPQAMPYTFGTWAQAVGPSDATLQLYVVASTASGTRLDPLAARSITVRANSGWRHLAIEFQTPADHLFSLQLMVRSPGAGAHVLLDGASLTEGPYALPFAGLTDEPASANGGLNDPVFRDSPLLGVGPEKEEAIAVLDNEFVSFLFHYGFLGLIAYVILFATAGVIGLRVALRETGGNRLMGVALLAFTVALGVSGISVGAFREIQTMFIFWLVVGVVAAMLSRPSHAPGLDADDA